MAIKKLLDAKEFARVCDELDSLFKEDNKKFGHRYLPISAKSISNSWANPALLHNTMHVWVNYSDSDQSKPDGMIMFLENINSTFGQKMFTEYCWISKNSSKSFSLLTTALNFAKKRKIKYVTLSCLINHPNSERLQKIYQKKGFIKDSITFIKKL